MKKGQEIVLILSLALDAMIRAVLMFSRVFLRMSHPAQIGKIGFSF